ncbi:methyl-accepting chemotaxis protein [Desulfovibrio intestinalis]|uniref:Methyl-accepting chemotaxis protein n=1 Tax=Desulfovibrio intestinalis TaxID=58621 RepID=A0A7W8C4G3_9BACT|nr:methyl-accepting chemotaxis protein [Desulfovibrio intestinalis]MBB5143565.1 methyl-accepting chemotaxis protein [Desulfovibrio intestinalis]
MKIGIMSKMMLTILVPSMLGLTAVCALSYWQAENSLTHQIAHEFDSVIDKQIDGLGTVQQMTHGLIRTNAESAHAKKALLTRGGNQSDILQVSEPDVQSILDDLAQHFGMVDGAGLVDSTGVVVAHTSREMIGSNLRERKSVQMALGGQMSMENLRSHSGEMSTMVAAPVKLQGKTQGVLYGYMSLAKLSVDTTDTIKMGTKGFCAVYDNKGTALMHPDKAMLGKDCSSEPFVQAAIGGGSGRTTYMRDDREMVAYYRHMPESNWHVVMVADRDEMLAPTSKLLKANVLMGLITAVVLGCVIVFVARGISRSLKTGERYVQAVAGGNFNPSPQDEAALTKAAQRSDEIGGLSSGIQSMVGKLRGLFSESEEKAHQAELASGEARVAMEEAQVARKEAENARQDGMLAAAEQLENSIGIISSASTELAAQVEQSDRSASESAQRLAEAATAMNEMNATVQEVARNASAASEASADTREKARSGAQIVERAVQSIESVRHTSEALKGDMAELNSHAQSITQIMNVISDIADQTNLLALNAAIEAARAGDAGRGFAVVADEVRKLAEKTMASTQDVSQAIKSIQDSTAKSMGSMDNAVNQIARATDFANQSGQALEEIVATVESTADQVNAIATASEEQSAASEEINRSIVHVNEISRQSAIAMAEATQAVSDLAAQAHTLKNLVAQMKLG